MTLEERIKKNWKIPLFLILTYILPYLFFPGFIIFTEGMSFRELIRILNNPNVIIVFIFLIITPILTYKMFMYKLARYNGSEKSINEVNKLVKIFENMSIAYPIILIILSTFIINHNIQAGGQKLQAFGDANTFYYVFSLIMGLTFLFSLLTYISFMNNLEFSLSELPFKKEHQTLSLFQRLLLSIWS